MKTRFILGIVGVSLAYSVPAQASISEKIHSQQREIHQTHEALNESRSALHSIQARESFLRDQLSETESAIRQANARLDTIRGQIGVQERRIAENEVQLAQAKATLKRHNDAFRRRLVDIYQNGSLGYLQVLLSAHSFSEFTERWDDIKFLIAANQRAIRERRAAEARVAEVQSQLVQQAAQLRARQADQLRQRQIYDSLAQQRRNLVAVSARIRERRAATVVELEESSEAQESQLQALIVEKQREEAAALEAQREAARRAAALSGKPAVAVGTGAPGDFSWPVSGPITSPFGMRLDPVSGEFTRMHTGIDIGVGFGTSIGAAAAGRVILAGWTDGGYGNMIVVDHGGGVSTLYAHCSQVFVSVGQDVQRGQALGAVGSTGHSTGPHLHFEVRVGGQPVDPTSRLR